LVAQYDVIVVGAGILGASTAYYLEQLRAGRVLLVDRNLAGDGVTGKSAAIIHQHYADPLTVRLVRTSIDMFKAMPEQLDGDGGFVQCGHGMLVGPDMIEETRQVMAVQRSLGIDASLLAGAGPPHLTGPIESGGIAAMVYEKLGGYADPVKATKCYVDAFRRAGGTFKPGTPIRALKREGDRITGVESDQGPLTAGLVVNAAGAWAERLASSAQLPLSLVATREHVTHWRVGPDKGPPDRELPAVALTDRVDGISLRPHGIAHIRVGRVGPGDAQRVNPHDYRRGPDPAVMEEMRVRLAGRFPALAETVLSAIYTALNCTTEDGRAYVGPRTGLAGYADASSGNHGFAMAPALGQALAHRLVGSDVGDDVASLSYDRATSGGNANGPPS
jgi:sarcosine oxidase subunit beta